MLRIHFTVVFSNEGQIQPSTLGLAFSRRFYPKRPNKYMCQKKESNIFIDTEHLQLLCNSFIGNLIEFNQYRYATN